MSKFGFNNMIASVPAVMQRAMQDVAVQTRDYFVKSFDTKGQSGEPKWAPLKSRTEPPPILNVTGELKKQTQDSIKSVTPYKLVMENTATDQRGRQYSNYHNEGTPIMARRSVMKQTPKLTQIQLKALEKGTGKIWRIV